MKTLIAALAALLPAIGQASLPPLVLYGATKAEMYKYAYPTGATKAEPQEAKGSRQMVFTLKGDAASGGGIGVDKLRLSDYVANGAVEFFVRGGKGGERFDVGFVQAQGMDAKDLAYQVYVPIANYAKVGTGWTKVTIPLKDFPKEGSRWSDTEKKRLTGLFNWSRVSEFIVSREAGPAETLTVAFTNVSILPSYDASKVQASRQGASAVSGPVVFYADAYSLDAGGAYAYPGDKAKVEESGGAKAGPKCLKVSLDTASWSGAAVYRAALDLKSFVANGVLEAWVKGAKGGESIALGLLEKSNGSNIRLPLANYLPGGLSSSWQRVQIPLKDFPAQGSKWDAAASKNVNYDFDWSRVGEVVVDNGGAGQANGVVFLDEVTIKPKP